MKQVNTNGTKKDLLNAASLPLESGWLTADTASKTPATWESEASKRAGDGVRESIDN